MTETVWAAKGPLVSRRVLLADSAVSAATAVDGWAVRLVPGNRLIADPYAPPVYGWVIPGWTNPATPPPSPPPPEGNGQRSRER